MKAFAYLRVSSAGQAGDDRDGLVRQKEAITKYAAAHGLEIVMPWFEDSITGKSDLDHRPGLRALMGALHGDGVKIVIVEKVDRLARDLMIQESIIADLQRNGFELVSTLEPDLCSNDPTRVLMRQILGAFSQYERSMIVLKLRGARDRAKAKDPNYREGRRPFGEHPGEQETIKRILTLRNKNLSLGKICDVLTKEGRSTRDGGRWQRGQVDRILKRA